MRRVNLYLLFGGLSLICFIIIANGSDIAALILVGKKSLGVASSESFYYTMVQPVGTAWLLLPFLALGCISAEVGKRTNVITSYSIFFISLVVLGWLYFSGYWGAQQALTERRWTAAALSIGTLPFRSIPIVFLAAIVAWGIVRWNSCHKTKFNI